MKRTVTNLPATIRTTCGLSEDYRFRKWVKWIDAVDPAQNNGYRFSGEFLKDGTVELELDHPRLVLAAAESGSSKYHNYHYALALVNPDLTITDLAIRDDDKTPGWAIRLTTPVQEQLAKLADPLAELTQDVRSSDLASYPDAALVIELRARGYTVSRDTARTK